MTGKRKPLRRALLLRASEILEREATSLLNSCKGSTGPWACSYCKRPFGKCLAQLDHEDMLAVSGALRKEAA
jgi:hypothetical protein